MDSKLFGKVAEGIEVVAGIKTLLVLPAAALYLAVVPGGVGADELVPNTELGSCLFKKSRQITPAVGKPVGKLKAIIGLGALYPDAPVGVPLEQISEEIGRGVRGLLWVSSRKTQTGKFVNVLHRDCRYAMSCVILLLMKNIAPSRRVVVRNFNFN